MSDTLLGYLSFALMAVTAAAWIRAVLRVDVPQNRVGFILASVAAAALGVVSLSGAPGWLAGTLALLSVFTAALYLLTVAIGGQKVGDNAIQVGATVPHFTAIDEASHTYDSAELTGNPALIKFFRGHW